MSETPASKDQFLSGRAEGCVYVLQPKSEGFRSGMDAVLLAAAIPVTAKGVLYDLGTGTGAAAFCAAARVPGIEIIGVERDHEMLELAREGLELPENAYFADRVKVLEADITMSPQEREDAGLIANSADWVIANPPFYAASKVRSSPHQHRREANILQAGELEVWFRLAAMLLAPGGHFLIIHMAEALAEVLELFEGRFGSISVRPIHPRKGKKASRVILSGVKGSRGELCVLPGFVMHATDRHTPEARAILRYGHGFGELH